MPNRHKPIFSIINKSFIFAKLWKFDYFKRNINRIFSVSPNIDFTTFQSNKETPFTSFLNKIVTTKSNHKPAWQSHHICTDQLLYDMHGRWWEHYARGPKWTTVATFPQALSDTHCTQCRYKSAVGQYNSVSAWLKLCALDEYLAQLAWCTV